MENLDNTAMGGYSSQLHTTRWSLILAACTQNDKRRRLAVEELLSDYWKPVYCFLRRRGYKNEEAKDLTQEFFFEFFLDGKLLKRADRNIGGFRQLLVTVIKRFVANYERDKHRIKRKPKGRILALESSDLNNLNVVDSQCEPEQAFYYAWITNLLDQVLTETKTKYSHAGMETHWNVFYRKILAPIFEEAQDLSLKDICQQYDIENESKASNMMITVKRGFGKILMRRLKDLTHSESEAEAEFMEIFRFLSE